MTWSIEFKYTFWRVGYNKSAMWSTVIAIIAIILRWLEFNFFCKAFHSFCRKNRQSLYVFYAQIVSYFFFYVNIISYYCTTTFCHIIISSPIRNTILESFLTSRLSNNPAYQHHRINQLKALQMPILLFHLFSNKKFWFSWNSIQKFHHNFMILLYF